MKFLSYSILVILLAGCANVAAEIDPARCKRAAKYSEDRRGTAMLVIQNGKTIFEHYANGGAPNGRWPIFSGTKSFWGIAALCAVRDGIIQLDDPVANTIPEWKNDLRKSGITIRQLLNFTDGIEGAPYLHRASIADRNAMAIRLPSVADPDTHFIYGPSHLQIFMEVLRRRLNGRSPISYLADKVLQPLGLYSLEFKPDSRGNPLAASGFELSAREWARFGQLILGRGNYHGQEIVPENLLAQAWVGSRVNPSYGLTFWLNRGAPRAREIDIEKELDVPWSRARWANTCISHAAPPDMMVALGSDRQRLFIIPSLNAIIVRQGQNARFSDGDFLWLVLSR